MSYKIIDRESRPKRTTQVIAQKAANDWLLFNMEDGQYFSLNDVGGKVWELCDGNHDVSQMIAALANEYDAPAKVLELDILELLEDFEKGKLIILERNSENQPQTQASAAADRFADKKL